MDFSYWEYKSWLSQIDFTVIGSGIVGLNCALRLKEAHPKANILVLEMGFLPQGASTKNAGFACFGSLSELLSDLNTHSEEEVIALVEQRAIGLHILRKNLGDKNIAYKGLGGFELFLSEQTGLYETCLDKQAYANRLLRTIFKTDVFSWKDNNFGFKEIKPQYSFNKFEGQIDTGKMMMALLHKIHKSKITILNNCKVSGFTENTDGVEVITESFSFSTGQLFIATNGFASQLMPQTVKPARAQVLITKPISNLHIKGAFHLDRGYYYFRNVDNRILFGGGRQLDYDTEETISFGLTDLVQYKLEELLTSVILPDRTIEIEKRWSGIMGVGHQKRPIIKTIGNRVHYGVRLGGMGIAIGTLVGRELADLLE